MLELALLTRIVLAIGFLLFALVAAFWLIDAVDDLLQKRRARRGDAGDAEVDADRDAADLGERLRDRVRQLEGRTLYGKWRQSERDTGSRPRRPFQRR